MWATSLLSQAGAGLKQSCAASGSPNSLRTGGCMTCGALVFTLGPLWAQSIQLLHSPAKRETSKAGLVVEGDVVLLPPSLLQSTWGFC